jgi:hypothetical protein
MQCSSETRENHAKPFQGKQSCLWEGNRTGGKIEPGAHDCASRLMHLRSLVDEQMISSHSLVIAQSVFVLSRIDPRLMSVPVLVKKKEKEVRVACSHLGCPKFFER